MRSRFLFLAFPVPETIHQVVVYKACGLEVGIEDSGSQELESPLLHIPGKSIGEGTGGGDFRERPEMVYDLFPVREIPEIITEAAMLLPDLQEALCVIYGGLYFLPVPDNPRILKHAKDAGFIKSSHFFGVESLIEPSVSLPPFKNG